jgi:ABC-type multidrug transport system fused ATPase/permease subunit
LSIIYLSLIFLLQNRLFASYMRRIMREESESHMASNSWLAEVFRLYPEMRAGGLPTNLSQVWSSKSRLQAINNSMRGFVTSVPRQTFDIVVILGAALLIASQAFAPVFDLVLALTVVTFVIFRVLPALLRIQNYVLSLIWAITESRLTREIWGSLEESEQQILHKIASRQEPLDPSAPLTFKSVTFSYPDSVPAVRDASFELPATGLSVLQGESGAGKSTIISLSLGLLPPAAGLIRVFGAEPERFFDLRNGWVAYVPQRPQGNSGTIKDNVICYREETREPQFIYECLVRAGLEKVMSRLPQGIDTPLSEFGGGVSGGELQRLVLARALYGRPKLLVLDEPFSALDVGLEESLSETLLEISLVISVLIATHRASFLTNATQFLELQHGELTVRTPSITGVTG